MKRLCHVIAEYECYNERRYGKPWAHRITEWDTISDPSCDWGNAVPVVEGSNECCDGCALWLKCQEGDIVVWGQRDKRRSHNSELRYGVIGEEGGVALLSKATAFRTFQDNKEGECVIGSQDDCIEGMTKHLDDQIRKGKQ